MLLCPLVKPDVSINMATGEISLFLGKGASFDPTPISPDVFALPGELTKAREFAWRYALTSFSRFPNSTGSVENAIRNQVQKQREVGMFLRDLSHRLMEEMLSARRPFIKPIRKCCGTRYRQRTERTLLLAIFASGAGRLTNRVQTRCWLPLI
jgi:hypothetical protein